MQRTRVESSVIASVGYEVPSRTLEIEFTSGRVYHYFEVPVPVHRDLMRAESHGSFFNAEIRRCYAYVEVHIGGRPSYA
jgi:hypothetical protein